MSIEMSSPRSSSLKFRRSRVIRPQNSNTSIAVSDMSEEVQISIDNAHSEEIRWFQANIQRRHCYKFVLKHVNDKIEKMCKCGWLESDFCHTAIEKGVDWSESKNTKATEPTNAFGEIEFTDYMPTNYAKYARVDVETKMDVIMEMLTNIWGLHRPNLVLSVTGGAKSFDLRPKLRNLFCTGLIKAAQSTGAWIITGGMDAGVMKHVGEAVRNYTDTDSVPIVCLGIAPWGCIANREEFLEEPSGKWPAKYTKEKVLKSGLSQIDSNHTHFVFVDNGTNGIYGSEIAFRTNLEVAISKMKTDEDSEDPVNIPLCCVVLEGGPNTLETVRSALEMGTPVVIIEGSGRAANVLAYAFLNSDEEEIVEYDNKGQERHRNISKIDAKLKPQLLQLIDESFNSSHTSQASLNSVEKCLYYRDLVTIFNFESANIFEQDLDVAILKALLKANKDQVINQLKLALTWSRADVARKEIFTDERKLSRDELSDMFYRALVLNRTEFVKLFMENGLALREFLSIATLIKLYNSLRQTDPGKVVLKHILFSNRNKRFHSISLEAVGLTISDLLGEFYHTVYLSDSRYTDIDPDIIVNDDIPNNSDISKEMAERLSIIKDSRRTVHIRDELDLKKIVKLPHFDDPARDLFIWCILTGRFDMSLIFWEELKESMASALTASFLLNQLAQKIEDRDVKENYLTNSNEYQKLAFNVLQECYSLDPIKAQLLLIRNSVGFGNVTCLELAEAANNMNFVSHSAVQALLNNIWMGRMSTENSMFKIGVAVLSIILVPFWPLVINLVINFGEDESEKQSRKTSTNNSHSGESGVEESSSQGHTNAKLKERDNVQFLISNRHENWIIKFVGFCSAPIVKFTFHSVSYLIFLMLFSYIMICNFNNEISMEEIILIVWVFSLLMEELRQAVFGIDGTFKVHLFYYLDNLWNMLDLACTVLFITGEVLRFLKNERCLTVARVILAFDMFFFYLRILHSFAVHPKLGPKLVMIYRMIFDMIYFVVILLVFVISYGITLHVVLYHNSEAEWGLIASVLKLSYFQMFGQLYLDDLTGKNPCTSDVSLYSNFTLPRCSSEEGKILSPIMTGIYILLTSILMFNLLIAMFSCTFEKINLNSNEVWRFQRLNLIREYSEKPILPPPFILLNHLYLAVRMLCGKCYNYKMTSIFEHKFNESRDTQLKTWEKRNAEEYLRKNGDEQQRQPDYVMKLLHKEVFNLNKVLTEFIERFDEEKDIFKLSGGLQSSNQVQLVVPGSNAFREITDRVQNLEKRMDDQTKILTLILKHVESTAQDQSSSTLRIKEKNHSKNKNKKRSQQNEDISTSLNRSMHINSRSSPYPLTQIQRQEVTDDQVDWDVSFSTYSPISFTHNDVKLDNPPYVDPDLLSQPLESREQLAFNKFDEKHKVNRESYVGHYKVIDGIPYNVVGRTGLAGRGILGRFGPNHSMDLLITRWKRDTDKKIMSMNGLPLLETVLVSRKGSNCWEIPGKVVNDMDGLRLHIKNLLGVGVNQQRLRDLIDALFERNDFQECYKGYQDDSRNTDNAWMETKVINFHDTEGTILSSLNLKSDNADKSVAACWMTVTRSESIHKDHDRTLRMIAMMHGAHF